MLSFKIKKDFIHAVLSFVLFVIFFNPFNISKYVLLFLSIYIILTKPEKQFAGILFSNIQFWVFLIFCILYSIIQFKYEFISI